MSFDLHDKNFRLDPAVRPHRYSAHLTLNLDEKRFEGRQTIELELKRGTSQIVLHGIDLSITRAEYVTSSGAVKATARAAAESETLALEFEKPLAEGRGALELEWRGAFTPGLRGLYQAGQVAVTQFEAADARRLFPCFDEPSFKARWSISLDVPKGVAAIGNGAVIEDTPRGERRLVRFAETEVLSSYLIALAVGALEPCAEEKAVGVPVRTWAVPEKIHLTRFGQEVALAVLPKLQDYFGLPYAFGKVDQVGVPDFEAGAMENAGLITYREVALLVDPATASVPVQKRIAEVITHELAHQWFGNWVTMVWWDDLWLNEAFATWMAYKIVDQWKPEWRVWLDFQTGTASALGLDALSSTHPIRGEVLNAHQATENFDAITYEKGGAVLLMLEGWIGADKFRDGIRQYMKRHARANAVADDLWRALGEASSQPVQKVADTWIRQSGFPLVALDWKGDTVTLSQRRFYGEPKAKSDEVWPVPVVLRYRDSQGVREHRLLLESRAESVRLPVAGELKWVCGNGGSTGFYRVGYSDLALQALAANLDALEPSERISLLADRWALVRSGEAELPSLLALVERYRNERDYAVLDELVGRLSLIDYRLVPDAELPRFRQFVRELLGGALETLGWDAGAQEDTAARLRRAALARAVVGLGRDDAGARELSKRIVPVLEGKKDALEANLHDVAVHVAARQGDAAFFDQLLAAYRSEKDPAFRRRYLGGLTAFEAPALAQRAQQVAFSDDVPLQDFATVVSGLLANPIARDAFWSQLRTRWSEVEQRVAQAPFIFRRVVEALGNLRERRHLDEVRAHLSAHPNDAVRQSVAQTLERLAQDVALRERAMPQFSAWRR